MNLEETRVFFSQDRYASEATGAKIEAIDTGYAKCSLKIEDRHKAAYGQVMGGVYFTLADFCFAVATNHEDEIKTVSMSSYINFLSRPKDDMLYAESVCIKEGKRSCFYLINLCDGLGNPVATVNINGIHIS